jgi:hypothetical protein
MAADNLARATLQVRTLRLYSVIGGLMVAGILGLVAYSISLGPLVGPGVESSFGLAVGLMFLQATVLVHLVDRVYRVYPFGRRLKTAPPGPITDQDIAWFLRVLVIVAAVGAVAYILGSLIAT